MKHALRIVAGIAVSAVFLYFAFRGFDFNNLRIAIANLKWAYVPLAMLIFPGVLVFRAIRWRILVTTLGPAPLGQVFPAVAVGYLANSVLPARAGEVIRAAALSRKTGLPFASMAGTLVADRVMDLVGLLFVMLVASGLLPWDRIPIKPVAAAIVVGLIGMYVATTFLMRMKPADDGSLKSKVLGFFLKVIDGFRAVRSPAKLAALIGLSLIVWLCDILTIIVLSRATELNLGFQQAAGLLVGIAFGVAIPAAPGAVGTYEFFGREALTMMGYDPVLALTFVVLLHFFHLSMMAVMGLPSLLFIGRKGQ